MTGLVECNRCNKYMINEEYPNHQCIPEIRSHKTIQFTNYYVQKNDNGTTTLNITTKDGVWLECVEIPENKEYTKIPYQPKSNTKKTTDDETEPEFAIVLYYAQRKSRYNGICLRCFTSSQAR